MTARNKELANLVLAALVASAAFASVSIATTGIVTARWLGYVGVVFGLYVAAHVVARRAVPFADPTLLPLAGLLTAVGLTVIYRLDPEDARRQAVWVALGIAIFAVVLVWLRWDYRVLERYKYLFGISAVVLLLLPSVPGLGHRVNGVKLWVKVGGLQFQPGELAKIFLIVFLAGYLRDKREALAQGRLKDLGPLLAIWGAAMLVLVQTSDLGSALLNFGIFLAMLYAATGRALYVGVGLGLFLAGSAALYNSLDRVQQRVTVWLHPWTDERVYCAINGKLEYRQNCDSYQLVKSLYSIANGGYGGTGLGKGTFETVDGTPADPLPEHRLRLLGDRAGDRARRRRRGAAPVHGLRRPQLPDRADRAGRLLEAARGRPRLRLRPADVHHRRRRAARRAAHRHHAPVRLVRRVVDPLELRHAGPAPARLQPCRRHGGPPVNGQIKRIATVAMGLLVALVVATTYWQTWARPALAERQDNEIQRVAQFEIRRGVILTPSRVVARNRAEVVRGKTFYFRRYPQGKLAAHVVGYSTAARSRTGLERSLNDYLTGSVRSLSSLVDQSLDKLNGRPIVGDSVRLTLDLNGQKAALDALGDNCGAVVALDPRTGRLRVMASSPSYDPNQVESDFGKIEAIRANCTPASPLLNRASQGLYPPGSTFKVVTASAALESGVYEPTSTFYDPGYCTVYGKRVNNFDTSSPFGNVSLATALQYSVNSVFCNIGLKLGARRILKQAKAFGFYDRPPLETPESERRPSGLYRLEDRELRLYDPRRDTDVDAGPHGVRPGATARDTTADGDGGRHDRQRRHPDAPVRRRPHRHPERQDAREDQARADPARGLAGDCPRRRRHDGARGAGGHGYRGPALRAAHRRQDGHGGDRRGGQQRHVVHRLRRSGRRTARARDRGRAAEPVPHRRRNCRPDRTSSDAGAPAADGESLTYGDQ